VLNGDVVQEVPLDPARRSYTVTLPRQGERAASSVVEFRYGYTRRPADVEAGSQDTRQLGMVWYSVDVVPAVSHLQFGDPAARDWMRGGWSADEAAGDTTYVWSDGPRSALQLALPGGQDVRMDFSCQPYLYPNSPTQTISIVLNGTSVQRVELRPGLQTYTVVLPGTSTRPLENTLEFIYGYVRPQDSADAAAGETRQLGVAWHSIDFAAVRPR